MILVSIGKITDITPVLDKYNFKLKLSKKDKSRLNSIIHKEDKNRMLAARFLLGQLLIQNGLTSASIDQLNFNNYGKPQLNDFYVSISHSGNMATVAISPSKKIGIDIQKHENISFEDYNSVLTKKEIEFSNKLEPGQKVKWFFDIWCRKEAIMKADGRGMSIEPDSVLLNDEYGFIANSKAIWYNLPCPDIPGYSMALYSNSTKSKLKWYQYLNGKLKAL